MNDITKSPQETINEVHNLLESSKGVDALIIKRETLLNLMIMYATIDSHLLEITTRDSKDRDIYIHNAVYGALNNGVDMFGYPLQKSEE